MRIPGRGRSEKGTTVFFATDVHGSERTWRKFLNAAAFYQADVLVMGGDVMGKLVIPVIRGADGRHRATIHGRVEHLETGADVARARQRIADLGFYDVVMDEDAYLATRDDPAAVETLWRDLATERLTRWIALCEDRLGPTGIRCYVSGGNDDLTEVMTALPASGTRSFVGCEGRVVPLDDRHAMISLPYVNPTPWHTPREAPETELTEMIEELVAGLPDLRPCHLQLPRPARGFDAGYLPDAGRVHRSTVADRARRPTRPLRGRQYRGQRGHRPAPATARAPRSHPRVAGGGPAGQDAVHQPRERVRRGRAARMPDLAR